jgi:hypothetical protein
MARPKRFERAIEIVYQKLNEKIVRAAPARSNGRKRDARMGA